MSVRHIPIFINRRIDEPTRRRMLYDGALFALSAPAESTALVTWARELSLKGMGITDLSSAHKNFDVAEFVRRAGPIKSKFTNDPHTRELCRSLIVAMGHDPQRTYFDLPRLRIVPPSAYLSSGVSYNYKAHRDTWYAHPTQLINYWIPVFDSEENTVMSMYLDYFRTPVKNQSEGWDYDEWVKNSRFAASQNVGAEKRPHPVPLEDLSQTTDVRIIQNAGDILLFSTCQLHASAPHTSDTTRYSFDLRTLDIEDLIEGAGPPNIDAQCTGTTISDFIRVSDFEPLDPKMVRKV